MLFVKDGDKRNFHNIGCGIPEANDWADKVEACFARDKALSEDYNNIMSNGKWKGMMTQKHIGYTSWNDDFSVDKQPYILSYGSKTCS